MCSPAPSTKPLIFIFTVHWVEPFQTEENNQKNKMMQDAGNCSSNMPWVEVTPSTQFFGVEEISYILPGCALR